MTTRVRLVVLAVCALLVASAGVAVGLAQRHDATVREHTPPSVATGQETPRLAPGTLVFRHTGVDEEYGVVATVALDDPGGPRSFTDVPCERVDAVEGRATCLQSERGVVTRHHALDLDDHWQVAATTPLAGQPSRTRLSDDGSLAASTVFVAGHSYLSAGFSTATVVRTVGGSSFGNLEKFQLLDDGRAIAPRDRNVWGVTFAADDRTFYATTAWSDQTHLVRGDLRRRTLTVVADHVECPSLSPDGTRVAFKEASKRGGVTWWTPAVLDLATGERTVLAGETHTIDDQLEWLDDDTVLYGLTRADQPAVTDVWALDTSAEATPRLLVEQAWSPAVVR